MKTERYSHYTVASDLLESDGYGPLDHASQAQLEAAINAGRPPSSELSTNAAVATHAPTIIKPYWNYFLFLAERLPVYDLDLLDDPAHNITLVSGKADVLRDINYLGGYLKHDTEKDSSWIEFGNSNFSVAQGISVGTKRPPKIVAKGITCLSLEELERYRTKPYPLGKLLPQLLSLKLDRFPKAFCFDGTAFFQDTWISDCSELGRLGIQQTGSSCLCTLDA